MSPRASYIRVRNWDRYQHYSDRNPPWIKLHVELLDKHDTMTLPVATRWLAISLLLLAARNDNVIDLNVSWLARESNLTPPQTERGLKELTQCRFIEPVGRKRAASAALDESLSSRARTRSASVSEEGIGANDLVAHYVGHATSLGVVLPRQSKGAAAQQVGKLVREGIEPRWIRRALELLTEKGLNPASLPSLVVEAQREGQRNGKHGLTAAQILALPAEEML